jgi:uncharacterized protein (TIGR02453 family)
MISRQITRFLEELARNNNKEWFHANKADYQAVREEFKQFVAVLIAEIAHFDESVKNILPKDCIFRINRDIRFSKDKRPYKNNFGAFIAPGGKNSGYAGYYFHIEPGNSFLAGGVYMPSPQALKAIRNEIYENTEEFKSILNAPGFVNYFGGLDSIEMLKTAPKGFPKDFKDIELLNHKHYTVSKPLDDSELHSEDLTGKAVEAYEALYPLNYFLNDAIENSEEMK